MATFKILPEPLLRLSKVINFFEPSVTDELKAKVKTVRLENKNGVTIGISTNVKLAIAEYLGKTQEPDSVCHLKMTEQFINEVKAAQNKNEFITVTVIPEIAMATAQIGAGGTFIGDACIWLDSTPLDNWREWFIEPSASSEGIMCWDTFHVETLAQSSPSGKIVFPEFINANKPVVVRDRYESRSWLGVFLPSDKLPFDLETEVRNRKLPEWMK